MKMYHLQYSNPLIKLQLVMVFPFRISFFKTYTQEALSTSPYFCKSFSNSSQLPRYSLSRSQTAFASSLYDPLLPLNAMQACRKSNHFISFSSNSSKIWYNFCVFWMMPKERITIGNFALDSFKSNAASMKKASFNRLYQLGLILFQNCGGRSRGWSDLECSAWEAVKGLSQVSLRLSQLVNFSLLRITGFKIQ